MGHLIKPDKTNRSHKPCFKNWDGRTVKVAGCTNKSEAQRRLERCELLVKAKLNGDPPPAELSKWIANMDDGLRDRLIKLELLDRRRKEQSKPIGEHIGEYEKAVKARRNNTPVHAKRMAANVRRACDELNIDQFPDLDQHDVLVWLDENLKSARNKEYYLTAVCDFANWMTRTNRAARNPMADTPRPSGQKDEEHVRRPLTVDEFRSLTAYLDTFDYYPNQQASWTAQDRKMIYWTGVCTAYRQNELRNLRKCDLNLNEKPAAVDLPAKHAKNRTAGSVPIPCDLADALKTYTNHLHPATKIFSMPSQRHSIIKMFRRDLEGAGINHTWETGEVVDFHTLRTTAICWWLDVYGLPQKRVQILARLKTMRLVERYSRKLRLSNDYGWLDDSPVLVNKTPSAGRVQEVGREAS